MIETIYTSTLQQCHIDNALNLIKGWGQFPTEGGSSQRSLERLKGVVNAMAEGDHATINADALPLECFVLVSAMTRSTQKAVESFVFNPAGETFTRA